MRHFYRLSEFSTEEIRGFLDRAAAFKKDPYRSRCLERRQLGLLFLNPSLRTRCSFEVAIRQLGGGVSTLEAQSLWKLETEMGVRMDGDKTEHVKEAVGVLSRYFDGIGLRAFARGIDEEEDLQDRTISVFMEHSKVPVFNMESAAYHPCQALADLLTIHELMGGFKGRRLTITWAPHPYALPMAVPNSILLGSCQMGMEVTLAHPPGFEIQPAIVSMAQDLSRKGGGSLRVLQDQREACLDAEAVYAKAWGGLLRYQDPAGEEAMRKAHDSWTVTQSLMSVTRRAYFMHCLPVRRNVVVSDEVLDSAQSVVFRQAENRLHVQKAVLEWIYSG